MVNFFLKKILGTQNDRVVKQFKPTVDAINSFEPAISKLSDAELKAKTGEFRNSIAKK